MIATLVIGLREGLEAALIVGIIAAFLRRNGKSLVPMWIGVGAAIALSVAVGVVLRLVEQALPQAAQEGLESVIGAVAVVFVTGMIVWMSAHARAMRTELEGEAADALGRGGAGALAVMAFLAVLKEGFETSVFLLATFSAAQSAGLAALGAVLGIALAVGIGTAIYLGGTRVNLGRFFRVTGAFLILVAAGLVVTTLRTAHEAGWLVAGQQTTVNLSWLVAPGTVQSALVTGVLGVPADPRLIEVVGWFAYLVPVVAVVFWPHALRPRGRTTARLQFGVAGALLAAAAVLALVVPMPATPSARRVALANGAGTLELRGSASAPDSLVLLRDGETVERLRLAAADGKHVDYDGVAATEWVVNDVSTPAGSPSELSLDALLKEFGGRLPIGLNAQQNPGPFASAWSQHTTTTVWIAEGELLDARRQRTTLVTLSGGGLQSPRTLTASSDGSWSVPDATVAATASAFAAASAAATERTLWAVELPLALVVAALCGAAAGARRLAAERRGPRPPTPAAHPPTRSTAYAAP